MDGEGEAGTASQNDTENPVKTLQGRGMPGRDALLPLPSLIWPFSFLTASPALPPIRHLRTREKRR
jgi:hypothetical protein